MTSKPTLQPEPDGNGFLIFDPPARAAEGTDGLMFLEKLCLAIIRANPDRRSGQSEKDRLRQAMLALVPDYYLYGQSGTDDRQRLYWMASQWLFKLDAERPPKPPPYLFSEDVEPVEFENITELARAALQVFPDEPTTTQESSERRLSRKFRERDPAELEAESLEYRKKLEELSKLTASDRERTQVEAPDPAPQGLRCRARASCGQEWRTTGSVATGGSARHINPTEKTGRGERRGRWGACHP